MAVPPSEKTYADARVLALAYYKGIRDSLPVPMREMPRYIYAMQSLSVNDVIANIQNNTDLGKEIVFDYAKSMNWTIVGTIP